MINKEQLKYETTECMKVCDSFLYFVLNFGWIEDKETSQAIPFALWDSQQVILSDFLKAYRLIILKARQLGLTWLCAAYALWLCITKPLQLVIVISAKEDWAIEFLDRVKFILDRLPSYMYPKVDKRTGQNLSFQHRNGLISEIKSLATTPEGAQSKTPTLLILDETARNRYIKEIWASSKPGIDAAKGRIILISNSIKDGVGWSWTRDVYTKSMQGVNDFTRIFMPWWDRPGRSRESVFDEDIKEDRPSFIYQQLREGMDEEDISQHYPSTEEEAISAMAGSFFGKTLAPFQGIKGELGSLVKGKQDSDYETKNFIFTPNNKGTLEVWSQPEPHYQDRYAIGSDVSEGLGVTYSVAYVYDRLDQQFVARMRSNRIAADIWADRLMDLGYFYNTAMVCPERNGAGITTILRMQDVYPNLFYGKKPGKIKGEYILEYGWNQSEEKKQILAGDLKRYYRDVFHIVPCAVLLDESSTFIRHENGKIAHEEGKLDDCVIAAALSLQASFLMPELVDTKPGKRKSSYDRRIDRLEQGDRDSWAEYASHSEQETIKALYGEQGERDPDEFGDLEAYDDGYLHGGLD